MTLGGAALGATYAIYFGADIIQSISYVVAGSGLAPLSIACGKFIIRAVTDLLDRAPPESCQFVRQDIATLFTVGIVDFAGAHRHDFLNAPHSLVFNSLFAAGAGNLAPLAHDMIIEGLDQEAPRNRRG